VNYYFDAEYNAPTESHLGLVSLAIWSDEDFEIRKFWLLDETERQKCIKFFKSIEGETLVAYAVELAESRVIYALGLDPLKYEWRDLMLDWRWLKNSDDRFQFGRVIETEYLNGKRTGRKIIANSTPSPFKANKKATKEEREDVARMTRIWQRENGVDSVTMAGGSLLDALVFFDCLTEDEFRAEFGIKNVTRDLIIKGKNLEAWRGQIQDYNAQDILHLPELTRAITEAMNSVLDEDVCYIDPKTARENGEENWLLLDGVEWDGGAEKISKNMGEFSARQGVYAMRGLPLDGERLQNFTSAVPTILKNSMLNYNETAGWERYTNKSDAVDVRGRQRAHPKTPNDLTDEELLKFWGSKRVRRKKYPFYESKFTETKEQKQDWAGKMESVLGVDWKRTDTGDYSFDEAFLQSIARDVDDDPIKMYLRQTKEISSVRGLSERGKLRKHISKTDWVHRYSVDPYSTQRGRNGQGASRFIFSAPHWFRALVNPHKGEAIADLDFGSQEIFIASALSGDKNLMESYLGGDPYWSFAQLTGAIPEELGVPTEEQRGKEPFSQYVPTRGLYKSVFLGVGFGMKSKSLARHISQATGEDVTPDDAQEYIDGYAEAYSNYWQYRENLWEIYHDDKRYLLLPDGWRLGSDNPSPNSTLNLPVQGFGQVILRRACKLCDEAGIETIATLHDAITIKSSDADIERDCERASKLMRQASFEVLGVEGMRVGLPEIVRHGDFWAHSGRAKKSLAKFKKYLIGK